MIFFPQEAVSAEQQVLGEQVEHLLSWLRETEAHMNEGMAGLDQMQKADKVGHHDKLTQQLSLCKASCPT